MSLIDTMTRLGFFFGIMMLIIAIILSTGIEQNNDNSTKKIIKCYDEYHNEMIGMKCYDATSENDKNLIPIIVLLTMCGFILCIFSLVAMFTNYTYEDE